MASRSRSVSIKAFELPASTYMYTCKIEADAKVSQHEDVGNMDSLRRAFRSMFKRKKRDETPVQSPIQSPSQPNPLANRDTPVSRSSSHQIPPSHPLAKQRDGANGQIPPSPLAMQLDYGSNHLQANHTSAAQQDGGRRSPLQEGQDQDKVISGTTTALGSLANGEVVKESVYPPAPTSLKPEPGPVITNNLRDGIAPVPPPKDDNGTARALVPAPLRTAAAMQAGGSALDLPTSKAMTERTSADAQPAEAPIGEGPTNAAASQPGQLGDASIATTPTNTVTSTHTIPSSAASPKDSSTVSSDTRTLPTFPAPPQHQQPPLNHETTDSAPAHPGQTTQALEQEREQIYGPESPTGKILVDPYSTDDKMLADEEPAGLAIKTLKVAPGMSATSGPLEDFPADFGYH
ncbi:hypothetical protein LTR62_006363 [Meristemomyces frigidus]|uniref:Uncharacterized protein n=1 Tax=Meristemomyces frigidus TaxID=1508187 RepID=A0AAN7YMX4_9PEZI|nr:hypothetical protein LTR62_006363 [Meristemomyces frigidus]